MGSRMGRASAAVACLTAVVLGAGACTGTNDGAATAKEAASTGDAGAMRALRDAQEAATAKQTVSGKGTITVGETGPTLSVDSAFRYGPAPVVHAATMFGGSAQPGNGMRSPSIEYLVTETQLYAKVLDGGDLPDAGDVSRLWIRRPAPVVAADTDGPRMPSATADAHLALQDPVVGLAVLAAAPDVRKVGDEPVDGIPSAHYRGVYPASALKSATAASLGLTEGQYRRLAVEFLDNRQTSVLLDIWLGPDRLPVRQSAKSRYERAEDPLFKTGRPGSRQSSAAAVDDPADLDTMPKPLAFGVLVTHTGWGSPVDVAEPPAEQIRTP
ncbi:hypothetical protein [Embleya sp. AB8]|uniref:hypothetical protein n=1 Tax=Embleya sp. AB8 TaxID=3156304 RepID=UPI003C741D66